MKNEKEKRKEAKEENWMDANEAFDLKRDEKSKEIQSDIGVWLSKSPTSKGVW